MQIPIISPRGNIKPWGSIPRINWQHPLARGLLFYHYDTPAGGFDLARGRLRSLTSANRVPSKISKWGTGYNFPSSTADGIQYASDSALRILPPFSWASGFLRTVAATEADNSFFCRAANSLASAPFLNWSILDHVGSTTNEIGIGVNSAGLLVTSNGIVCALNAFHTVVASAPTTASVNWWINGAPQTTLAGLTIQSVTTGDNIIIGTDLGGPGGFQGQLYWAAFWNRAMTQAEASQLSQDPNCLLIYPEDEMFATLVGVVAATTSEDSFHQPWSSVGRRYAIIAAG